MSSEEVLEKVKGIIVEQLGVSESAVTMEASFKEDLKEKVVTVGDVVDYIKENVK